MTQINLLPWREQERQVQQIQFAVIISAVILAAILLVAIFHICFNRVIGYLQERNVFLQTELTNIQVEFGSMEDEKKNEDDLLLKLMFLMGLRSMNYQLVQLLNEMTRLVPSTILLTKVSSAADSIQIEGNAQTDLDITHLMKNLTTSTVVTQPVLTGINASQKGDVVEKHFQLKVMLR